MQLINLLEQARQYPIFAVEDCQKWFPKDKRGVLLLQLNQYVKKWHLIRLRRGLYLLNKEPLPHPFAIASRLKPDAVISAESVLSANGIIPEISFAVTAITGGRNHVFTLPEIGAFIFRHIDSRLVFGWRLLELSPYSPRVAIVEKALLDFLWFHILESDMINYLKELRLNIPRNFSWDKFRHLARQFDNKRLLELARLTEEIYR